MRNQLLAALALAVVANGAAYGASDPATWNRNVERLDYFTTTPNGGDNAFFTYVANATSGANVVLVYPANNSMKEFTHRIYDIRAAGGDCTNSYLDTQRYFMPVNANPPAGPAALQGTYNPLIAYPDPGKTYTTKGQSDGMGNRRCQSPGPCTDSSGSEDVVYGYGNWPAPDGYSIGGTATDTATACGGNATCINCLTSKGYWINPAPATTYDTGPTTAYFTKNRLRFSPPKWTLLSLAYKRLVNGPLLSSLREGVLITNDLTPGVGARLAQKMLPQSCNGSGRPIEEKRKAIDDVDYTSSARPLAEMLFNTAWFMGGQDSPWLWTSVPGRTVGLGFPGIGPSPLPFKQSKSGPCNGCASDFVIVFSDGRGDSANPACTAAGTPAWCTTANSCTAVGLGTELDGNDYGLDPTGAGLYLGWTAWTDATINPAGASNLPARATYPGTCDMDFADDIALWLKTKNVSSSGTATSATTHVVAIGDDAHGEMSVLRGVAANGQGNFLLADNFGDLEDAIELVFRAIRSSASSFASSAVTTVQTTGTSSAFIPRFTPAISGTWSGTLSRYVLFNEFAAGCTTQYLSDAGVNPNGDNSCSDFYLKDSAGNFIQEDPNGNFVISDNSVTWDAGWPARLRSDGGTYLATPYWEAGQKLTSREVLILAGTAPPEGARRIFTVRPSGSGYGATSGSTRAGGNGSNGSGTTLSIDLTNAATLGPLFGLSPDEGSEMCLALSAASGNSYDGGLSDCAADVIRYLHGEDVLRSNPANRQRDAGVTQPRLNVMGDIFHSSPILVTPPAPRFLCDLGVLNQCVASLYSPTLTPGGTSYTTYISTQLGRDQNVLVGANDGMLHAFNAAHVLTNDGGSITTDNGDGIEAWAFIPPDLLPKLVRNMVGEQHELFVDGTPMVRDIWVDGSGPVSGGPDNVKQDDEFHTIVVFGQRQGGRGYTALDITDSNNPVFLWSWPRPGTKEALAMGQTWNDLGGAPPAIGPIAKYNDPAGPLTINGDKAQEQYVVAFGGGYDPNYVRGRSMHIIDAWTGDEVYRFSAADTAPGTDLRRELAPVPAPISMIDVDADGLFDHALFGDMDGQVWNLSMMKPGRDTGSDGLYDTWFMARAFEQQKGSSTDFKNRSAFFQRIATGMLPTGDIRIYLGGGDRAHLKDFEGGTCGPDNLSSCFKRDMDVTITNTAYQVGPPPTGSGGHFIGSAITFNGGDRKPVNAATYDSVGQVSATDWVTNSSMSYLTGGTTNLSSARCDWGTTDAGVECPIQSDLTVLTVNQQATPPIANTEFYSIKLFDTSNRAKFMTQAAATIYDTNRLTNSDLNNVTNCPTAGTGCVVANVTSNGWFLTHGTAQTPVHGKDEKTAASALLFGGCVLWATLDPIGLGGSSGTGAGSCLNPGSVVGMLPDGTTCNANSECFVDPNAATSRAALLGVCDAAGADPGKTCDNDGDCDGRCSGGRDDGKKCDRDSAPYDCRDGAPCVNGGCSAPEYCRGLGQLSCTPSFPKDTAYSYQGDAITGAVSCGLAGSQTYTATSRATSRQVSVAPTQPAPVVSVNAATGMIQYSAVTLDASSVPTGATLGSTQISSTVHWLEVGRKVHDCRHGTTPGVDCAR
jgi:type IV pilus assembly protein PilY1